MFVGADHSGVDRSVIGDQRSWQKHLLSAKVLRRITGFEGLAPGFEL